MSSAAPALDIPQRTGPTRVGNGPIIVASDGSIASDAALAFAAQLGARNNADVLLLSVVEPVTMLPLDYGVSLPFSEIEQAQRQARLAKLLSQFDRLGLRSAGWQMALELGDPVMRIADVARERDAAVVITGLGKHELLDRIFGSETALGILRLNRAPLLAVAPHSPALPRVAVIATDFSVASLDAARTAVRLFSSLSEVHLVHVMARLELPPEVMVTWDGLYAEPVAKLFDRVTTMLALPDSIRVRTVTREGKASREVLRYARSVNADVIVTGSRGAGFVSRLLVGSTATGIIRGADRAVLAVPAAPGSERLVGEELINERDAESKWSELLSTFSRRNIGRRTSLEVDDPDYGLLIQEHGYPLLGIAYDHHDLRVWIILGDVAGTKRHLTRGITGAQSIDILRDALGRDRALRVAHGRGQTLLTFET